jgi:hypothetical protein
MTARSLVSIGLCVRRRAAGDAVIERSFLPIAIARRCAGTRKSTPQAGSGATPDPAPSPQPTFSPTVAR